MNDKQRNTIDGVMVVNKHYFVIDIENFPTAMRIAKNYVKMHASSFEERQ